MSKGRGEGGSGGMPTRYPIAMGSLGAYQLQTAGSQLCHAVCLFAVSIVT